MKTCPKCNNRLKGRLDLLKCEQCNSLYTLDLKKCPTIDDIINICEE